MSLTLLLVALLIIKTAVIGFLIYANMRLRNQQRVLDSQLQASDAQYRQIMMVADLASAVLTDSGHIVDWNPALEKLYGRSRAEVLGQAFFLKYAPLREGIALAARATALRSSDDVFEFTFAVAQDGNALSRQVQWRARHFTDARDNQRYLSLIGNDVTALEFARGELADSEARFRQMFESVPVALALIDPEGRLRMVNSEAARFFGFDAPEQMVALSVQDLIHPDDQHASAVALTALRERAETLYQMETCYVRRDGVARWGNARGVLIDIAPGLSYFLAQISDVHERKQTERALMESERRLATLIANLSGAVYRYVLPAGKAALHHDLQPEFLSDGVESITGQSQPLFLRRGTPHVLGQLIFPEDRPLVLKILQTAMAGDGRFEVSYRLRHGVSDVRWIMEHGLVWQRPDGSWSVDGHLTDVSGERQAREAEQVYRTLVADTHTGFLCLNMTGRVVDVNEPFCTMFDLGSPEKVLGHSLDTLLIPGYGEVIQQFLVRVAGDGGVHDIEFSYTRHDGRTVHALINAIATLSGDEKFIKCLLVDISRAKRAEEDKRESEARYRMLFDTNINGVCFISLDGYIEAANPALCRILGHSEFSENLLGLSLRDITAPTSHHLDVTAREQIFQRGWCDSYRKDFRRMDDVDVPVSIQAWLVHDEANEPLRIMCVIRDLSKMVYVDEPSCP
jgi:PAS domain S-box-containing protein